MPPRDPPIDDASRVARNSFFLTAQPLFMNAVSLLAVAYIARKLGVSDFGVFNLVTTYTMLFYPVAQAGMNRVMVRDMASLEDKADYAAVMVPLRVAITGLATLGIVVTALFAGYDSRTTLAIIAGCSIFLGQVLGEIVADVFLASEHTHYTAVAQLAAGLTLTGLSVIVLFLGFGLFAMIAVYALGQFLGLALSVYFLHKRFFRLHWRIDLRFAGAKLVEGVPFFASIMMWTLFNRIDTVVLSKWGSAVELGLYTAPMMLVSRLGAVPLGVSNALLPAIARLWGSGDTKEAADLVRSVSDTLLILVLPATVFVAGFSGAITRLLFGPDYGGSGAVLAVGIWIVLLRCVGAVQFSLLAGSGRERDVMTSYLVVTLYCIVSSWLLVRAYGMLGAAAAALSTQVVLTVLMGWRSPVRSMFGWPTLLRVVALAAAMLLAVIGTAAWAPWWSMAAVAALSAGGAVALGLVRPGHLIWLGRTFRHI